MKNILLILPLQLFEPKIIAGFEKINVIYLLEEPWYWTRFPFHKQKLAYQHSAMNHYQQFLQVNYPQKQIFYIQFSKISSSFYNELQQEANIQINYIDPIDKGMQLKFKQYFPSGYIIRTPNFWLNIEEMQKFTRKKRYNFTKFYEYQKQKFCQLLNNKDDFGILQAKSQDKFNRNRIPKEKTPKQQKQTISKDPIDKQSIQYINQNFPNNYGSLDYGIIFPNTFLQAKQHLKKFFKEKLYFFGIYQDAIDQENSFLYHSVLSPMLNLGILTDTIILEQLVKFLYKKDQKIPIQSLEAFIRQLIGWRNYVMLIYTLETEVQLSENQLNHKNKLSENFWKGKSGIQIIDNQLEILKKTCYLSHIPRLMLIGNLMLLANIDPQEVFKWFSTMFIDSSDCLMAPNIIMSQYNSPIMMTRFYISTSNYIKKIANFKISEEDCLKWDILFKNFIINHIQICSKSYVYSAYLNKNQQELKEQKKQLAQKARIILERIIQ